MLTNDLSQKAQIFQRVEYVEYYTQNKKVRPEQGYDQTTPKPVTTRTRYTYISPDNILRPVRWYPRNVE